MSKDDLFTLVVGMIFDAFIMALVLIDIDNITAMDVYQGKTALEYTVVDGIKIDSCVVWKK